MTREQAKELLPIIQAYAEGKTLQYRVNNENNEWKDINNPAFNDLSSEYRIKPEPTYRPFKSRDECWSEMSKHQPFGWVKVKNSKIPYTIVKVDNFHIVTALHPERSFINSFSEYVFADGTPFGIKED